MQTYIASSVIIPICFGLLGLFFGEKEVRGFMAVWAAWLGVCLVGLAWLVYVIVHFVVKFW